MVTNHNISNAHRVWRTNGWTDSPEILHLSAWWCAMKICRIGQQKQKIMEKQKYKSSLVFFGTKCALHYSRIMTSVCVTFSYRASTCNACRARYCFSNSVHLSVRPIPVLCQITFLWRSGRGITLVFIIPPPLQNSKGKHWPFNWPLTSPRACWWCVSLHEVCRS